MRQAMYADVGASRKREYWQYRNREFFVPPHVLHPETADTFWTEPVESTAAQTKLLGTCRVCGSSEGGGRVSVDGDADGSNAHFHVHDPPPAVKAKPQMT